MSISDLDFYKHLSDKELRELDRLLEEEMYAASEKSLYSFFINFWSTFDPSPLINNWHLECLCEHAQAAVDRQIRRLIVNVPPRCLPSNVRINMADGSYKKLKDINKGDVVLSSNLTKINKNKVLNVYKAGFKPCLQLTFSNEHTLQASTEHKIYTVNKGWLKAEEVSKGDIVISCKQPLAFPAAINSTSKNIFNVFTYLQVSSIQSIGIQECLDLEVENDHNFFSEDILVHNSSKSTVNSITLPAFQLLRQPDEQFWLISHSERLFTQNIVYTRRIFDHPKYKNRWLDPDSPFYRFSITSDQNTKTRIDNNMGGRLMGGSPGTSALGMGYTVAVLDDILDSEESQNLIQISKVNDWYSRTFLNRSNDNNSDVVIIVMQRLHQMDLTGYVKEKYADQGWFILNLPARYDSRRTFVSPIGFNDKRTKDRELLDPIRLSDSFLAVQEKNPIIYETRYQQNPDLATNSQFYQPEYWRSTAFKNTAFTQRVIVWDLSFTSNPKSAHTVGLVMELSYGKYYVIDMFRKQCDTAEQIAAVEHMHTKYPEALTCIENKANGHAVTNLLSKKVPNILKLDPKFYGGSKEQRFGAVIPFCKEGKVWFYEPNGVDYFLEPSYDLEQIKKELTGFPLYSTNDIVDTFAYGLLVLSTYNYDSEVMVGTEKMKYTEEDYFTSTPADIYTSANPLSIYIDHLPTRDDLLNFNW